MCRGKGMLVVRSCQDSPTQWVITMGNFVSTQCTAREASEKTKVRCVPWGKSGEGWGKWFGHPSPVDIFVFFSVGHLWVKTRIPVRRITQPFAMCRSRRRARNLRTLETRDHRRAIVPLGFSQLMMPMPTLLALETKDPRRVIATRSPPRPMKQRCTQTTLKMTSHCLIKNLHVH